MMHTSWKEERKEGREGEQKERFALFFMSTSAKEKELLRNHCDYAAIAVLRL